MPYTDIHNHFVYGVDDGGKSEEGMRRMLRALHEDGITRVIATSHITPGQREFPMAAYRAHLEEARAFVRDGELDMTLDAGNEILYTDATVRYLREGKALTLAGSDHALIEFLPDERFERLAEAAHKVRNAGYMPVFAHIERYACLASLRRVASLKAEYGVRMQVNCSAFVRRQGFRRRRWLGGLVRQGLLDFVATDAHDLPGREPRMRACYETLKREFGETTADDLTGGGQERVLY
ncbi:MAG: hypothetical protein IJ240_06490 [Clostridia bacterium]|nr:hypothetical protein [Clostridia bacterium]